MKIYYVNSEIKHVSKIPFINYENGNFTKKQDVNYEYIQEYRRGGSGLNDFKNKFKEEFKKYNLLLNTYAKANAKTQQIIDIEKQLDNIFTEYINSFNNNKYHIDNDKIYYPDGRWEYQYNYGKTTLKINFDLLMILSKNSMIEHKEKYRNKIDNNNYNIRYDYVLKKISLESIRN